MAGAFNGCSSLTEAPVIPEGVTDLSFTFSGCTALVTAPAIPDSVEQMYYTFNRCTSLTGTITINNTLKSTAYCFAYTSQPIVLTGNSPNLQELADTADGNVTVQ